ncbi:hypothetical protein FLX27_22215 [Agrobacterium tumefaciens]|jgi:hypothetical protein|uniref:hypothetical protein n=1 Tax=Rhizobium sp. TaxID=391 RepID=UPI0011509D4B|nr:hypothetical protein [Agrobacterium tumefaciens]TQN59421.1 hypothetical protein FLX27_22215 [Agrobacterium tumefaciens]
MPENKAPGGINLDVHLRNREGRPKSIVKCGGLASAAKNGTLRRSALSAELGRKTPEIAGNVGNPANSDGRHV